MERWRRLSLILMLQLQMKYWNYFRKEPLQDTASSLSDAAISASVDATAAADAFIDGTAQKSVEDNKKIVVEKEGIKDAASSSLKKQI